jgi:hypothetical protein
MARRKAMAEKEGKKTWRDFMDDPYVLQFPKWDREMYAVRRALSDMISKMTPEEEIAYFEKVLEESKKRKLATQGMTHEERIAHYREMRVGEDE